MSPVKVVLVGVGQVGRAFLALLSREEARLRRELGVELTLAALVRTGRWKPTGGLPYVRRGGGMVGLIEAPGWVADRRPLLAAVRHALGPTRGRRGGPGRVVVVEVGAGETGVELTAALGAGAGAVLANKRPLAGGQAAYRRLMGAARRGGGIRYECTVGSALPVIEPLRAMLAAGDRLRRVRAALSGTLGFVMTGLSAGRSLAEVVAEARAKGLTEPDPRDDLGGLDVARKALILSRLAGWAREPGEVAVESLVPPALAAGSVEAFMDGLAGAGGGLEARVRKARRDGRVLRYVAEVEPSGVRVGLAAFGPESPFAGLVGTDNLLQVESDWYPAGPLVVRGPGAGVALTAAGVLADLVGLAQERGGGP